MVKGGFVVGLVRGRQIEARQPGGQNVAPAFTM
jgi:hypothetical protein